MYRLRSVLSREILSPSVSHGQRAILRTFNHEKLMDVYRSMPTAIENGALQRVAGGKEQGCDQDIRQVLDVGDGLLSHTGRVLCSR